ncbi:MAG: hypothetical protein DMD64_08405 [Gemmatimonadetes bacterium]|nr:MAG: hypothetical protein DMD64_08405 [Gemmatimonadota bacterium]
MHSLARDHDVEGGRELVIADIPGQNQRVHRDFRVPLGRGLERERLIQQMIAQVVDAAIEVG